MVSELEQLEATTNTKQQFAGNDADSDEHVRIFRSKLRIWHKIVRVKVAGEEDSAVILPFNTLIEPFYSEDDIDLTETSAIYDASNRRYELSTGVLGNRKKLQSKLICFRSGHKLSSMNITVGATYEDGTPALDGIDVEIYNGNEWIPVNNGLPIKFNDYVGTDLDADLDTFLYADFNNFIYGDDLDADLNADLSGFTFQNKVKYRIIRTTSTTVYINKVVLSVEWEF